jgi:hypothetical protein
MTEDLDRKKRVRAAHRAAITKAVGQAEGLSGESVVDLNRLRTKRATLLEKREIVKKLDDEILALVSDEELETEIEQADKVQEQLGLAVMQIEEVILRNGSRPSSPISPPRQFEGTPRPSSALNGPIGSAGLEAMSRTLANPGTLPPTSEFTSGAGGIPTTAPFGHMKLPELSIKKFNGDLTKWTTFWDAFNSTIHENVRLTAIEKFTYLQSLLEPPASEAISGLALTSANYDEATTILKKRYGNKQLIINKHMESLMNLESCHGQSDTKHLRKLYDSVETQVRGLKALGVTAESYGGLLAPILLTKLPAEIRLIVSRGLSEEDWDLVRMLEIIEAELIARERAAAGLQRRPLAARNPIPPTASALMTPAVPNCVFCGQNHQSRNCTTVPLPDARKQSLRRAGRCFICLRRNHISRNCRSSMKCSNCKGRHHVSICDQTGSQRERNDEAPNAANVTVPSTPVMYVSSKTRVMLQTAMVVLQGVIKSRPTYKTRAVFDCGSQRTYISTHIQQALSLSSSSVEIVEIKTFGSKEGQRRPCNVVNLKVMTKDGNSVEVSAFVVPYICDTIAGPPITMLKKQYPYLAGLDLAEEQGPELTPIDMLIGADHYWSLVTGRVCGGNQPGPIALETRVGWVLSGPVEGTHESQSFIGVTTTHVLRVEASCDADENLKRFWELESMGINPREESVQTRFTQEIVFKNGRYEVSLPWREGHQALPDNYVPCVRRLYGLLRRLKHEPELLQEYNKIICDQLSNGIIEEAPEMAESLGKVHYLPHHPVVRRDKTTTKLRVVYDASCFEGDAPSLNQCVHVGPSFDQCILDILIRFRVYKVALVGDVEKAFLMIGVNKGDRDALRFLWVDNPVSDNPTLVHYRFTRVVFGVASSPYLLNATIRHHINQYENSDPKFVSKFHRGIYVDDLTTGGSSEKECYEFYSKAKGRLAEAGFNLRKFVSNSIELSNRIAANEARLTGLPVGPIEMKEHRVLGSLWNPLTDQIIIDVRSVSDKLERSEPTKRNVVGASARIYDPMGILSPLTIRFKIFFQQICSTKIEWDTRLTGNLLHQWEALIASLSQVHPITIKRQLVPMCKGSSFQLVGFCDASQVAYAAVVYLRATRTDTITSTLITAKSRVAPLKAVTIPRLELLSALLLGRLINTVEHALREEIQLEAPICFSDSRIALCWIRNTNKEWKQFIENRVVEIRQLVPPKYWYHCPGTQNPADIPSRGLDPLEFEEQLEFWLRGPEWLREPISLELSQENVPEECLIEMKANPVTLCTTVGVSTLINANNFSSFKRLHRVMSQVVRSVRLFKSYKQVVVERELLEQDWEVAYKYLIHNSQATLPHHTKFKSWTQQFGLYKDNQGFWRCQGRLANANIPQDAAFPIFLEKENAITELIIKDCHERMWHSGISNTLAELRSKYWVPQGRQVVKRIVHNCTICRRFQGKQYDAPPPPPLPPMRVDEKPPFSYVGVDFAGPLYVRESISADLKKVWICMYTCCVSRAAHLDLVTEMTAVAFLRSLKRFTSRRGVPIKILSDNGSTFKAADRILTSIWKHPSVRNHIMENRITWQFNVERAPWWGGVFERMIQTAKRLLRKMIGTSRLTYDELMTAVIEVEGIINSRPLTYMSSGEMLEPLTPSHLLCGRRILTLPDPPH